MGWAREAEARSAEARAAEVIGFADAVKAMGCVVTRSASMYTLGF
jgi:hypothetical protein